MPAFNENTNCPDASDEKPPVTSVPDKQQANEPDPDEIQSITLLLENGEHITIPREHIGMFELRDITRRVARVACNSICSHQVCSILFLELHKNANIVYGSHIGLPEGQTVFTRLLTYHDITGVKLRYQDGHIETVYTAWMDSTPSGRENLNQSEYMSVCENLYIAISENYDVEDILQESDIWANINDADYMDNYWATLSEAMAE